MIKVNIVLQLASQCKKFMLSEVNVFLTFRIPCFLFVHNKFRKSQTHAHTHTCVKKWLVKYRHACTVIVIVFDYANKPNRLGDRFKKRPFPKCETYHIRQIYKLV